MLESAGVRRVKDFRVEQMVQVDPVLKAHILRLAQLVENSTTSAFEYSSALFEFAEYLARQKGIQVESNCVLKTPFLNVSESIYMRTLAKTFRSML